MESSSSGLEPALDPTRVHETADGDTDFEHDLFTLYIEDCEERLGRLAKHLEHFLHILITSDNKLLALFESSLVIKP